MFTPMKYKNYSCRRIGCLVNIQSDCIRLKCIQVQSLAWKDGKLCGLVRVLDDSEMLAYVHYVLVNPKYQGLDIAGILLNWLKRSIRIICILRVCLKTRAM